MSHAVHSVLEVLLTKYILGYKRTSLILLSLFPSLSQVLVNFQLAFDCVSCEANWAVGAAANAQWKHNKCSKPSPSGMPIAGQLWGA